MVDLIDDVLLQVILPVSRIILLVALAPVPDRTVTLMRRLRHLMQVQIADVDVRGLLLAAIRVLQAVITQDAQVLLILALVPLLDRFRRFNR